MLSDLPILSGALPPDEIRSLVRNEHPVLLDIGANCGQTTAAMLRSMPGATIHAFEPDPRAIAKFKRNIQPHPSVHLYECALGAVNGTTVFYQSSGAEHHPDYPEGWDQSGSIRPPHTHLRVWPWVQFKQQIQVSVMTLDSWAEHQNLPLIDFIWADVQGAEGDLITGGSRTLSKVKYLYTEYSNDEWYNGQVTLAQLSAMLPGFKLIRRYAIDALFENSMLVTSGGA